MEFSLSLPASIEQFRFTGTVQKGSHGRYALLPFFDGLLFLRLIPKYVYVSVSCLIFNDLKYHILFCFFCVLDYIAKFREKNIPQKKNVVLYLQCACKITKFNSRGMSSFPE